MLTEPQCSLMLPSLSYDSYTHEHEHAHELASRACLCSRTKLCTGTFCTTCAHARKHKQNAHTRARKNTPARTRPMSMPPMASAPAERKSVSHTSRQELHRASKNYTVTTPFVLSHLRCGSLSTRLSVRFLYPFKRKRRCKNQALTVPAGPLLFNLHSQFWVRSAMSRS